MSEPSENGGFVRIRDGNLGVATDIELGDQFIALDGSRYTLQPAEGGRASGPPLREALRQVRNRFGEDEQAVLDAQFTGLDDFNKELDRLEETSDEELPAAVFQTLTEEPPDEACTRLRKLLGLC